MRISRLMRNETIKCSSRSGAGGKKNSYHGADNRWLWLLHAASIPNKSVNAARSPLKKSPR